MPLRDESRFAGQFTVENSENYEKPHIAPLSQHVDIRTCVEELEARLARVEGEFANRNGRIRVLEDWQTQLVGTKVNMVAIVGGILTVATLADIAMRWFGK